jgi:DNA-binding protein H-NS
LTGNSNLLEFPVNLQQLRAPPRIAVGAALETSTVSEWEYRKIALNQLPRKTDDIDVLCEAGMDGWELVAILENNVAYFKRQVGDAVSETEPIEHGTSADVNFAGNGGSVARGYEVKAKYRDPKTNETWSGRGRMATWLKRKQDAGEDIDKYLV